jgi:hypothetical protein
LPLAGDRVGAILLQHAAAGVVGDFLELGRGGAGWVVENREVWS